MKKFKLFYISIILMLITAISSCKTDSLFLPIHQSSRLSTIAKLTDDKKVTQQEMTNWYTVSIQPPVIQPQWDKALQTMYNGNHMVEVPITDEGALFFIKEKNMLSVFAARWQDKGTWASLFTGYIAYYSFRTNKITASVYNEYGLIRTLDIDVPQLHKSENVGPFFIYFMSPDFWNMIKEKSLKAQTPVK